MGYSRISVYVSKYAFLVSFRHLVPKDSQLYSQIQPLSGSFNNRRPFGVKSVILKSE